MNYLFLSDKTGNWAVKWQDGKFAVSEVAEIGDFLGATEFIVSDAIVSDEITNGGDGPQPIPVIYYVGDIPNFFRVSAPILPGCSFSSEQMRINMYSRAGFNVLCRAVAGAGKTTTLLLCAAQTPSKRYLLLTYNKKLQLDVKKRAQECGIRNIEVMTYHAAAGKCYGRVVQNDEIFRKMVFNPPPKPLVFDVLLVDEAQDIMVEYFTLINYLLAANPCALMIVVGDELQSICEYRGSSAGFLTHAKAIYKTFFNWVELRLTISQRITPFMATFINAHLYRQQVITPGNFRSINRGVKFFVAPKKGIEYEGKAILDAVEHALEFYEPKDIFVLAPSVKPGTKFMRPLDHLIKPGVVNLKDGRCVDFYVSNNENSSPKEMLNKMAITTYNASKGSERKCVILTGCDESYFKYFDKTYDKDKKCLPNVMTVAATRASEYLIYVSSRTMTLRSFDYENMPGDIQVLFDPPKKHIALADKSRILSVTDLVRHVHPYIVRECLKLVTVEDIDDGVGRECPVFETEIQFGDIFENVAPFYGTAVPMLAQSRLEQSDVREQLPISYRPKVVPGFVEHKGKDGKIIRLSRRPDYMNNELTQEEFDRYPPGYWDIIAQINARKSDLPLHEQLMRLVVLKNSVQSGYFHISRQISNYEWVDCEFLDVAEKILRGIIRGCPGGKFEAGYAKLFRTDGTDGDDTEGDDEDDAAVIQLCGFLDYYVDGDVWEFKLGDLNETHILQVACYMALSGAESAHLVSYTRAQHRKITISRENSLEIVRMLIKKDCETGTDVFKMIDDFKKYLGTADADSDASDNDTTI